MYQFKTNTRTLLKSLFLLSIAAIMMLSIMTTTNVESVGATTAAELQAELDAIEAKKIANEAILNGIESEVDTLENKLAYLATQIDLINLSIEKTELEIDRLTLELKAAKAELTRQKTILAESLKTLYIEGNVSTLDLILASDEFTEFISQQEYLNTLKSNVELSTQKVIELKDEIKANKVEQEDLLKEQVRQKKGLKDAQQEQQELLNATKGQESLYQGIVANLEKQEKAALQALEDYLISQTFKSLGPVNKGDVVGFMGLTGYTTGVHLHFGVRSGGQYGSWIDPQISGTTLINGYLWPTESTRITAGFGASGCGEYVCGGTHYGLDIGAESVGVQGDLIFAVDDGDIVHRGYLGGSGLGYFVIIDHGFYWTYYGHLQG